MCEQVGTDDGILVSYGVFVPILAAHLYITEAETSAEWLGSDVPPTLIRCQPSLYDQSTDPEYPSLQGTARGNDPRGSRCPRSEEGSVVNRPASQSSARDGSAF